MISQTYKFNPSCPPLYLCTKSTFHQVLLGTSATSTALCLYLLCLHMSASAIVWHGKPMKSFKGHFICNILPAVFWLRASGILLLFRGYLHFHAPIERAE
ncbi:hypothetical protein BJ875DRAFT_467760 [Amylocarpus encephaloides]|uniref:Uncharacterized protein n=1 Tax=Amylocarpus encephaloides TaxID=45428 RepID=A0A9P7YFH3_9HELO|nr:hypothetical protein BJ875DRAFT_467760 [Amylocarpus encephaloides]